MARNDLHIYVWSNLDGLLFCPWAKGVGSKRIFVGGGPILTLNGAQLRAIVTLLFPDLGEATKAVFHDGNSWARRGCPDGRRGKRLISIPLS